MPVFGGLWGREFEKVILLFSDQLDPILAIHCEIPDFTRGYQSLKSAILLFEVSQSAIFEEFDDSVNLKKYSRPFLDVFGLQLPPGEIGYSLVEIRGDKDTLVRGVQSNRREDKTNGVLLHWDEREEVLFRTVLTGEL